MVTTHNIMLVCILISSAMLAAEDPLNADSSRNQVSNYSNHAHKNFVSLYPDQQFIVNVCNLASS